MIAKTSYHREIRTLLRHKDLAGLIEILRHPNHPEWRLQAARACGELDDLDASESLMRSVLEDPDPAVQAAARQSLQQLLGSQTEAALAVQRSGPRLSDPWLVSPRKHEEYEEEDVEGEDDEEIEAEDLAAAENDFEDETSGLDSGDLVRIALHEPNVSMRLRAIHALAECSDLQATAVLADLARYSDSRLLRNAACHALEKRYGEQAGQILESYQNGADSDDEDPAAEPEDEETFPKKTLAYPRTTSVPNPEAIIEEAGAPRLLILFIILVALLLVAVLSRGF